MRFNGPEIVIVLIIVLILFGPQRIGNIAKELGNSLKAFRDGVAGEDEESNKNEKPSE